MMLLAVSGGRDSVAMADLMHREGRRFAIAHCNFHLRPGDCDRDQQFVRRLAEKYGVPFYTIDFDTRAYAEREGHSVEEAARLLRYSWFADLCREHGFECVATAHHRDDSIETFFLNLFRGTGIAGLHGIRPFSTINYPLSTLKIVRPLLNYSRADIDAYIAENGLEYVEDSTNSELEARRNRIRLQLMPLLRQLYPTVDATMQANIDRLHDTELIYRSYIDLLAKSLVRPYVPKLSIPMGDCYEIAVSDLRRVLSSHPSWEESTACTLMFELLRPYGFNADTAAALMRSLDGSSGLQFHSPTHIAELHRGSIIIAPDVPPAALEIKVEEVRPLLDIQEIKHLGNRTILVDADNVRQPFTLRLWHDGDRFRPFGMKGSRLVSDFLKDSGLPLVERRHVFLLVDADDMPVWLVGLRADDRTRLTSGSSRILKISCPECPQACGDVELAAS